ncbi:MAG TPA: TonB-dependent receptor [Allosphingosinicella sp.]|jgi:TonB-dependent receptor|nr:TonB-dependent receptor [Allosphingosinicella sp.]
MTRSRHDSVTRSGLLLGTAAALALFWTGAAAAQDGAPPAPPASAGQTQPADPNAAPQPTGVEQSTAASDNEIVVTGYRGSLTRSINAKKDSVGFTDSIFAEEIGKFPDTNIAETFNRVPGVIITRETTGEGLEVSIRGLGTSFTRVLLNNAPIAIASTGRTDSQNTNREVDLNLFPTELFTRLTVHKSPLPEMLEGGAAGIVDMRSARPFDHPGTHFTLSGQGTKNSLDKDWGYRGSALASYTNADGTFGVLIGAAGARAKTRTVGYETIGWTNPNLVGAQCGTPCNSTGGGNFTIPSVVPANAGNGLVPGTPIDQAFLLAHNPGLTIQQIDNAIIPRLSRPSDESGTRDRYTGIFSLEWRPSDSLHFYLDSMAGKLKNDLRRIDMNWVGRNGAAIPLNMKVDNSSCTTGCVVTSATYANAQFFLEYRPFIETTTFWGVNPGLDAKFGDKLKLDIQGNWTKSKFHRESPSVLVITPASSGVTVNYLNDGSAPFPQVTSNVDLNNPANFGWNGGRLNIQDERRSTETKGIRGNLTWGDERLNLKVGAAYDDIMRRIRAYDNSQAWQNAVCGDNPTVFLPSPNSQPPCQGLSVVGAAPAGYPTYPGYGTGFTAGATGPVTYQGSLIPQSQLASFLMPRPDGFITVNWDQFKAASHYDQFHNAEPEAGSSNTGASGGLVRERTLGAYAELNGDTPMGGDGNRLRWDIGVRWVRTMQTIGGLVSIPDPRNTPAAPAVAPADGGKFPNISNFIETRHDYDNWLPSATAAYNIGEHGIIRAAVSRTMTRPNPNSMLPGLNFSSPSADVGSVGNPALQPFISENYDLGVEYYPGHEGLIGIAAFRKLLTGFTVTGSTTVPFATLSQYGVTFDTLTPTQQAAINSRGGPNSATVVLQEQVNASGKLTVDGVEITWIQPLDFIFGNWIKGLGFNSNLTIIDQNGRGAAPAVATGVPPYTYNITAYYENHGVSLRLSTTFYKGNPAATAPQNGIALAGLFNNDYRQWDFSSVFNLHKMVGWNVPVELTFDVVNLTKAKQRQYFQFPDAAFTYYNGGRTIMFGLRAAF